MRQVIEGIEPALWAAYSVAAADRRDEGAWPSVPRIAQLADRFDTCPWALLALTRAELPELDRDRQLTGAMVRTNELDAWTRPTVLAPTPECLRALYMTAGDLYCHVVDPWGRDVSPRDLHRSATEWAEAAHRAGPLSLAKVSIEPPRLPLQAEH